MSCLYNIIKRLVITSINCIKPKIIKDRYNLNNDDYILFLGRIVPEKGIHYLIDAFNMINTNKKLVIAGGVSEVDSYYNKAMDKVRNYIAANHDTLLSTLNSILFSEEWHKYGVDSIAEGQCNSMRIYIHDNPFNHVITQLPISTLDEVREAEVVGSFKIKGKIICCSTFYV